MTYIMSLDQQITELDDNLKPLRAADLANEIASASEMQRAVLALGEIVLQNLRVDRQNERYAAR